MGACLRKSTPITAHVVLPDIQSIDEEYRLSTKTEITSKTIFGLRRECNLKHIINEEWLQYENEQDGTVSRVGSTIELFEASSSLWHVRLHVMLDRFAQLPYEQRPQLLMFWNLCTMYGVLIRRGLPSETCAYVIVNHRIPVTVDAILLDRARHEWDPVIYTLIGMQICT